jgi:hypothetical protein
VHAHGLECLDNTGRFGRSVPDCRHAAGAGDGQQIGTAEPNFNRDLSGFAGHPEAPMKASAWNNDIIRNSL